MDTPSTPQAINQPELVMYVRLLANFDWSYEYSEDARVYKRAEQTLVRLRQMQTTLDPTGEIWMRFKPANTGPSPRRSEFEVNANA